MKRIFFLRNLVILVLFSFPNFGISQSLSSSDLKYQKNQNTAFSIELELFFDNDKLDNNLLIEKLKITSFPSTILIAPSGEIIARNIQIDELRKILNKELNSQ